MPTNLYTRIGTFLSLYYDFLIQRVMVNIRWSVLDEPRGNDLIIGAAGRIINIFTYRPVCIVKFISENNSDPLKGFLSSEPGRHTSIYYNSYISITFSIQSKGALNNNLSIKRTNFKRPSMQRWQCPIHHSTPKTFIRWKIWNMLTLFLV